MELCPKACKQTTVREQKKGDEDLNIPHGNMETALGLNLQHGCDGVVFLGNGNSMESLGLTYSQTIGVLQKGYKK